MGSRISSPGDTYYQGRGRSDVTNTDLGKTETTKEQDAVIRSLMLPRAKLEKMRKRKNNDVNIA
tara:strand:+ start:122 stop:313 length:192 start_codon:yes stop_codon:yes gene_type:complete